MSSIIFFYLDALVSDSSGGLSKTDIAMLSQSQIGAISESSITSIPPSQFSVSSSEAHL